jgi:hypothetical protein
METSFYNNVLPILNDDRYYEDSYDAVNLGLDLCKSMTDITDIPFNFYVYWIGTNINYKHKVLLKSYLATQDLNKTKLLIYADTDLSVKFPEFEQFKNIEFHIFDVEKECENTLMKYYPYKSQIKNHQCNPEFESDFFRLLMLYKNGGVYLDFDVLLMRDFSPLSNYEYVYQWGTDKHMMNGAVMSLHKKSPITKDICIELINGPFRPFKGSLQYANDMYIKVKRNHPELVVFPSTFFNSQWQHSKNKKGEINTPMPFSKNGDPELYEGCFAWHYHGSSQETKIEDGSKFDIVDKMFDKILKEKLNFELCRME